MKLLLKIKDNLYSEPKKGKTRVIKKDITTIVCLDSNDIISMFEILDQKGNIEKNYTRLQIRDNNFITVNHSIKQLNNMTKSKPIGFKTYGRN